MPLYCEEWLLELAMELVEDTPHILNLFSGMNKYGFRIDCKSEVNPTLLADAHNFANKVLEMEPTVDQFRDGKFNIILADPPYSNDESKDLYGTFNLEEICFNDKFATVCLIDTSLDISSKTL